MLIIIIIENTKKLQKHELKLKYKKKIITWNKMNIKWNKNWILYYQGNISNFC